MCVKKIYCLKNSAKLEKGMNREPPKPGKKLYDRIRD